MPKVGGSEFPYTPKGVKAAKKKARKTGKKMEMKRGMKKGMGY